MTTPPLSPAEENIRLKKELELAYLKIRVLEERLRLQRIHKYGPKSEKLSDAQLELLEDEPGVSAAEVEAESNREPLPATVSSKAAGGSDRRRHPGRQTLPADLPRVERLPALRNSAYARLAARKHRSSVTRKANSSMWSQRVISWP